ncbi:hypothetical protein GWC95_15740 [Sediminibacterium roseum]|uniref:Uncharacterized protein n=1 Tax=Sediminibacterium roseum TaxID=1978412 RepID=A0ABX0A2M4_9BACT|nr:hypothetical protein [Sediminibacterium roseum]NCI51381.1 hypothetical protein [Sediminibacterium roseum]
MKPKHGEENIHYSILLIAPDGQPGPTMGNYDTLQEVVNAWVDSYTEDGPDMAIVRVFSQFDAQSGVFEVIRMEVVSEEDVESVEVNDMSDTTVDELLMEMNDDENKFVADEHPDWHIKEFHAIVNYIAALDDESIGMEVPPVSTHDTLEDARKEHKEKGYSADYVIVIRQLKVNPDNPKEYYLFDEFDAERNESEE